MACIVPQLITWRAKLTLHPEHKEPESSKAVCCNPTLCWCILMFSLFMYSRVMSVCVTLAGRGSTANKKLMNVCHSPAKTTPPAQTSSTATGRCASWLRGTFLTRSISHLINAKKRSCSEIAICPSTGSWDNELQMAGKTNESINGSQHEKGFRGSVTHWRKKPVYLLQLMPLSLGRRKTASGGKSRGWKENARLEWLVVFRYSLPPSGIFTHLKSRYFRVTHILSVSLTLSLTWIHMNVIPSQCSYLLCPKFSCQELKAALTSIAVNLLFPSDRDAGGMQGRYI